MNICDGINDQVQLRIFFSIFCNERLLFFFFVVVVEKAGKKCAIWNFSFLFGWCSQCQVNFLFLLFQYEMMKSWNWGRWFCFILLIRFGFAWKVEWTLFDWIWRNDRKSFGKRIFFCRNGLDPMSIGHSSQSNSLLVRVQYDEQWKTSWICCHLHQVIGTLKISFRGSTPAIYCTATKICRNTIKLRWNKLKCKQFNVIDQINGTEIKLTKTQTIFSRKCIQDSKLRKLNKNYFNHWNSRYPAWHSLLQSIILCVFLQHTNSHWNNLDLYEVESGYLQQSRIIPSSFVTIHSEIIWFLRLLLAMNERNTSI